MDDNTSVQFSDIVLTDNAKSLTASKDNKECVICCSSYGFTHPPLRLSCCHQIIGHNCFSKYAIDRKRSYLKHNQTLSNFSVSCLFCNGCPEFSISTDVKEGSLLSTPSTINTTEDLITPTSQVFSEFQQTSDIENHIICLKCFIAIDNPDNSLYCGCCDKAFHKECSESIQEELKNIHAYQVLRGFHCGSCSIEKYMLQESLTYCLTSSVEMKVPHLLACVPHTNYLLSLLISYACGANYNRGNPWKSQDLVLKYSEFKTLSERLLSLLSHSDISHFRNDVQRNLRNFRNVFVPSSTMLEFLSRDPQLQKDVLQFCHKLYSDACAIYSSSHILHLQTIHDNIINAIDGIQGYVVCFLFSFFFSFYLHLFCSLTGASNLLAMLYALQLALLYMFLLCII